MTDAGVHLSRLAPLQQKRFGRLLKIGTPAAALAAAISPFVTGPFHFLVSVPLLVLASALAINSQLVSPVQWLLSRPRRFLARWTRRFVFYPVATFGFSVAAAPLLGALAGAATFASLAWGAHSYLLWNAELERRHAPIRRFEKVALVAAGLVALGLVVAFVLATALAAWLASVLLK